MPVDQLNATFAALADPTRRAILARLVKGEATVNELAAPWHRTNPVAKSQVGDQPDRTYDVPALKTTAESMRNGRDDPTRRREDQAIARDSHREASQRAAASSSPLRQYRQTPIQRGNRRNQRSTR
jgi:hypothetical protein